MSSESSDASLRGRIAALERWARTPDRTAATAPARAGLEARFAAEVDPDGTLDPAERAKRVGMVRRAYFARLARRSAQKRRSAADAAAARSEAISLRQLADEIESAVGGE
jgi:hypothetical protein